MKRAILLVLIMISFGCTSAYKPPTTGKTATAKISGLSSNKEPFGSIFKNSYDCTQRESLSEEQLTKGTPITIRADEPFTFFLGWHLDKGSCGDNYTFTPKEGKQYQIQFLINFQQKRCGIAVTENDQANKVKTQVDVARRQWEGPLSGTCKPL